MCYEYVYCMHVGRRGGMYRDVTESMQRTLRMCANVHINVFPGYVGKFM